MDVGLGWGAMLPGWAGCRHLPTTNVVLVCQCCQCRLCRLCCPCRPCRLCCAYNACYYAVYAAHPTFCCLSPYAATAAQPLGRCCPCYPASGAHDHGFGAFAWQLAIRRAYEHAGVDPTTVTLVEGHGTGTPVGDAIELTALKNVLGEGKAREGEGAKRERVAVGSIKSNIGHLKAVAGAAGMIKVILALKHKILPATINVKEPPKLRDGTEIQDSAIYINTRSRPWFTKPGLPRRAGVSSFGFGGSNYHCVIEEYESEHTTPYRVHDMPEPFFFAAPSKAELLDKCTKAHAELSGAVAQHSNSDQRQPHTRPRCCGTLTAEWQKATN